MANKKTRAMRRAEYLRQRNAMETQAKEALNRQAQTGRETVDSGKSALNDTPAGGVNQQICLIPLTSMNVRLLSIHEIRIAERIRRDSGSLEELAQDIQAHGLLNPITVMEQTEDGYVLIAGLRRLKAMEQLGEETVRATVMSPMEADEMLLLEISENEQRKNFTTAERLAFAERIQAVESEKGKQRRMRKAKESADFEVAKRPPQTDKGTGGSGKVRDIVARKAGFSSTTQMRRAKELADVRPDLVEAVDKGETSSSAWSQAS